MDTFSLSWRPVTEMQEASYRLNLKIRILGKNSNNQKCPISNRNRKETQEGRDTHTHTHYRRENTKVKLK